MPSSIITPLLQSTSTNVLRLQWNPSIADTVGEWHFGCYTEVAVVEGFRVLERPLLGNGILAVIQRWLL